MKRFTVILLVLLMLASTALAADGSVTYEGGAEKFVFLPGSKWSDSDMFDNFKKVLPGDVLEQIVQVKNGSSKTVRIYMRAEGASAKDQDFLNQLHLNVTCKDSAIFDAQADEKAQLTENTLLGTFKTSGETDLIVTLTVPTDLCNEYMNNIGIVPWTFMVEEIPEEEDTPQTSDWFNMAAWIGAAGILLAGMIVLLFMMNRKRKGEAR